MISRITFLYLLLCCAATADTIYLRNGHKITGANIRDDASGAKLQYEIGDNTFSIAKSAVDHVDKGGSGAIPPGHSRLGACKPHVVKKTQPQKPPIRVAIACQQLSPKKLSPGLSEDEWTARCAEIIENGTVNDQVLTETESECNSDLTAASYYLAGNFQYTGSKPESAIDYFKTAHLYKPDDYEVLTKLALVSREMGDFDDSLVYFQQLADIGGTEWIPSLGTAYYLVGRKDEAFVTWKTYISSGNVRSGYTVDNYVYLAEQLRRKYGRNLKANNPYNPYDR
jgi:tetratricopeptide (TPR) repeat protein